MSIKILLYGATGYMGRLVAKRAVGEPYRLIMAGRGDSVRQIAAQYDTEARIFPLTEPKTVANHLEDVDLVANFAGPFVQTSRVLAAACVRTGSHYIDIAGEALEFQTVYELHQAALDAGVMLLPGVGFGVVPTDILAYRLKVQLPTAKRLVLAFATEGGVSQGTLRTVLNDLSKMGVHRVDGELVPAAPGQDEFSFKAGGRIHKVVTNPWRADLFTAYLTTGIPNIETYSAFPAPLRFMMRHGNWFEPLLRSNLVDRLIGTLPNGPSEAELEKGKTYLFGQVEDERGEKATLTMLGPEAYLFSALTTIAVMRKVSEGRVGAGFQTPALIYGDTLLKEIAVVETG